MTAKCETIFPLPLPDDPQKWDGWSKYKSPNLYERLCLDARANPSNEVIEEHCRELLRWWQKKLPLKNQPSNPLAQLLRPGLEESSRYLTEARMELLDPERRRVMDDELAAREEEEAVAEFHKYLAFAITDGILSAQQERNLLHFGSQHGLSKEKMVSLIDAELADSGARRAEPQPQSRPLPQAQAERARPRARRRGSLDPPADFDRMLRLSGLGADSMTDDQRDAFINIAENLGIDAGEAEDMVDAYLDECEGGDSPATLAGAPASSRVEVAQPAPPAPAVVEEPEPEPQTFDTKAERAQYINFQNSLGGPMMLIPSAEFTMGSDAPEAAPNEKPTTRVTVSRFFLSRYLITNADYEQFDPSHARKRAPGAGDRHPVVYVSSLDAIKFCQWLGSREHKRYRLPTEAEWEYAARGADGRRYPWGNYEGRGDLANFADKNTVFAWSDREIDDGYPESSPIGAFPLGASPFGMEDMAGNVWEWCLDYFEPYRGAPKVNPRGPKTGAKRVHRGGSWKSRFNSLRTTTRGSNVPSFLCNDLGFRIACDCD
jgi:formylglycine-generating enzyme required for sulfatase activity